MARTPGRKPGARKKATKKSAPKAAKKSKARPPKAKPPSARGRNKPYAQSEVASVRVPSADASMASMRFHAGKDYVYDPHQRSASWWHESHYGKVSWSTFRNWQQDDDWTSRREAHWRTVEQALGKQIASDLVREQAKELKDLQAVRTQIFGMLLPADDKTAIPPPKSFESIVSALVAVDKRVDDKRGLALDGLPLALGSQTSEAPIAGPGVAYSDEELRAMAQARMRVQQKQLESAKSGAKSVEDGEGG